MNLQFEIEKKWQKDHALLPLTSEHYELYHIIHSYCHKKLDQFPNLVDCQDFNDRIQWLKLFDQSEEIIQCSDKILVRDYVRERVGEQYLTKLYQVHEQFLDIDFESLPQSFVIKVNHDSGTVILVKDKSQLDYAAVQKRIDTALERSYGWENGEWAYSFVQPKILIEEYLNPEKLLPPPDYKFYCVEGKVKFLHYIYDRGGNQTKEQTLDREGNDLKTELYPTFQLGNAFIKPEVWTEMLAISERISADFKCVRVDLYHTNDRIIVGELTFWPMAGCYKGEGQKKVGQLLDFDRTTVKPFLLKTLEKQGLRFIRPSIAEQHCMLALLEQRINTLAIHHDNPVTTRRISKAAQLCGIQVINTQHTDSQKINSSVPLGTWIDNQGLLVTCPDGKQRLISLTIHSILPDEYPVYAKALVQRMLTAEVAECVIYGAGAIGHAIHSAAAQSGLHVLAFIESSPHTTHTLGIPIMTPEAAVAQYGAVDIVIASVATAVPMARRLLAIEGMPVGKVWVFA
jgi:hypothetical protein